MSGKEIGMAGRGAVWRLFLALTVTIVTSLALSGLAAGQDLPAALDRAEARVEGASLEIAELESAVGAAQDRLSAGAARAAPRVTAARAATRRASTIANRLRANQRAAEAKLARIEEERRDAATSHDEKVRLGVGLALAALITAGIALAWGWFRASTAVAWLARQSLSQTVGLCVGGGLLIVIAGGAMSRASGAVGAIGAMLFVLGFVLANAFVLARHSAEVQRGRSKPILGRERLPRGALQAMAAVFVALFVLALGTAVFAGESQSSQASASLRREAATMHPTTPALVAAKRRAELLQKEASPLAATANRDRRRLRRFQRDLGRAEARLANAKGDVASFTHRLAALTAREEQRAAERERREEEQAERERRRIEHEEAERCDPNYSGCLDPHAVDYDCEGGSGNGPLYTGPVEVLGVDHYGLDADGDGIGCDS